MIRMRLEEFGDISCDFVDRTPMSEQVRAQNNTHGHEKLGHELKENGHEF